MGAGAMSDSSRFVRIIPDLDPMSDRHAAILVCSIVASGGVFKDSARYGRYVHGGHWTRDPYEVMAALGIDSNSPAAKLAYDAIDAAGDGRVWTLYAAEIAAEAARLLEEEASGG